MSIEAIKLAAEFNRYFTSANGVDVPAKVSVSRDEWRALFTAIQQAEAQQPATGEPGAWEWRHLSTHPDTVDFGKWSEWKRVEARSAIHTIEDALAEFRAYIAQGYKYELRALYTHPQATPVCGAQNAESDPQAPLSLTAAPQQATPDDMKVYASIADRYFREAAQAELTNEQIKDAAVKAVKDGKLSWLGFEKDDQDKYTIPVISKSHYQFARAILALRPERVPMTEDQVWHNDALMSANGTAGFKMDALMRIVRAVEAHHGIKKLAKKETP